MTNSFDGTVSVIETENRTVVDTFPVGRAPAGVALTPDGTRAYVAEFGSDSVSIIDTASNSVVNTVALGDVPWWVAIRSISDTDGDGVPDDLDVCADTVIPEGVPTRRLGRNRFALVDDDGIFDTNRPPGRGPGASFTVEETAGCSCEQIIVALDLGKGHLKFGCSIGA